MLANADGGSAASGDYDILDQVSTVQVNPNNTTTAIEQITFRALRYDVVATFNVLASTYQNDGAPALVGLKCAEVEQLCGHDHVVGARGAPDIDPANGRLYNYLVVTVGTPDFARTSEVWIRMDKVGTPGAFGAIDKAWNLIQALGPTGQLAV